MHRKFFIVGAQKAGTTALHSFLAQHSELTMSTRKELHFFDDDTLNWESPPYGCLEAAMGCNGGGTFGEATPIYMYWPDSIRRLHRYDPDAKIIVLLRHPIFRAHSHWRMETKRRSETLPFSEAIRDGRARVKQAPGGAHRVYSYVERGFYAGQIEQILGYFPHTQVHIATTDQLWAKPKFTLNAIERFLGVGQELDPRREYIVSASTEVPDLIKQSDFKYLMELFRSDIRHTASLTGIPLQDWLDENYTELDRSTY